MRVRYVEGDPCSPKYVAGAMAHAGHLVSRETGPWDDRSGVLVLSDMPADRLADLLPRVGDVVADGAGLLLVGGWTSLGRGGYARSAIAPILPVELFDGDDRVNTPMGLFPGRAAAHPVVDGLPFHRPPVLTGYDIVVPRGRVVMDGRVVEGVGEGVAVLSAERVPLLVVGAHGRGRVAVLATDLAPHWSGGWTDWGGHAIPLDEGEEVGDAYVRFLDQLLRWLGGGAGERAGARDREAVAAG